MGDLGYRFLQAIPPEVARCTRLRRLVLDSNYIQRIEHLPPQLEELLLGVNDRVQRLENLPAGLRVLMLCGAEGVTSLEGLPAGLRELRLTECGLTSLRGLPPQLQKLDVACNYITSLEGLPDSLRCLNVENNLLASLEGLPAGLRKLRLHQKPSPFGCASDNPVAALPPLPPRLRRLRTTIQSPLVGEVNSGRWAARHGAEDVSDFSDGDITYTTLPDGSIRAQFGGDDSDSRAAGSDSAATDGELSE